MNVVDSCGWLEYFANGPNADFFAPVIENERGGDERRGEKEMNEEKSDVLRNREKEENKMKGK